MIPTIADLLFASARTFTQVVALPVTNSEPAVRVGVDCLTGVRVASPRVLVATALGAGFINWRAGVSVAIPGNTFARCLECFADDGYTATEARRVTAADCGAMTLGVGGGGVLARTNRHAPKLEAKARAATTTAPVLSGIRDRVTVGHQRHPSREAG